MIRPGTGNLLLANADALVNTVNCVGVMGKGIALQFKKAYPAMFNAYVAACKAGDVKPGHIHVWPTHALVGPRYILNFPTKRHWRNGSRLDDVQAGLVDLARLIPSLGLRSIAIPPLGAGNGGLDWSKVKPVIVEALAPFTDVDVHLWNPGPAPVARERVNRTTKPRWTPARAAVVALMGQYRSQEGELTSLEVQKLAYFLQASGYAALKLKFRQHHYGPYADPLYHLLQRLEGHAVHGLVDRDPNTRLTVAPAAYEEASRIYATDASASEHFTRVCALIEGFENPYGLELLATVYWVAQSDDAARSSAEGAYDAIQAWNERKRFLMERPHVQTAWERLTAQGWLSAAAA